MRIHQNTISEINQRVDLLELISESVVLKKSGKSFIGCCPFHEDKSPSLSVSSSNGLWNCFGCGESGDSISWLMKYKKLSFQETIFYLGERYNVPIQSLEPEQQQRFQEELSFKNQLYEVLALAANYYSYKLTQNQLAAKYLTERGISQESINEWGIGYAPSDRTGLCDFLVKHKRKPLDLLEKAGLLVKDVQKGEVKDKFWDRIIFPIKDIQGRVIGFGGRILGDDRKPKYLNSPENLLFNKSSILFGLDRAHQEISRLDEVVLVEGYFDVVSLYQVGVKNVLATMGTSVTPEQLKLASRYTPSNNLVLALDNDESGMRSINKIAGAVMPLISSGQLSCRVLLCPGSKDSDEFLRLKGIERYLEELENAPAYLEWRFQQILFFGKAWQKNESAFTETYKEALKLLESISDRLKGYYIRYVAKVFSQGKSDLQAFHEEQILKSLKNSKNLTPPKSMFLGKQQKSSNKTHLEELEETLIRTYLHCQDYREVITNTLEEKGIAFAIPLHRRFWSFLLGIEEKYPGSDLALMVMRLVDWSEFGEKVFDLLAKDESLQDLQSLNSTLAGIELIYLQKSYFSCQQQMSRQLEDSKARYYWQQMLEIKKEIETLKRVRFALR